MSREDSDPYKRHESDQGSHTFANLEPMERDMRVGSGCALFIIAAVVAWGLIWYACELLYENLG